MFQPQDILRKRYQLIRRLGNTATGRQTWLAQDLKTQESVAIKLLSFNPQTGWKEFKLFEREAQILQTLNHPLIPKYRDSFEIEKRDGGGVPWFALVQDYIAGQSLQESIDSGKRFSETEVKNITKSILDLLIYLHELSPPVLHRDIKPSNIMLGDDGRVYLVDFGAVQDRATVTGVSFTVVGTSGYAPFEQYYGRAVAASDIYALGATAIHLLTGIAPSDLPMQDNRFQFRNKLSLRGDFLDWLEKATESAAERRFVTARIALDKLEKLEEIKNHSTQLKKENKSNENELIISWQQKFVIPLCILKESFVSLLSIPINLFTFNLFLDTKTKAIFLSLGIPQFFIYFILMLGIIVAVIHCSLTLARIVRRFQWDEWE